MVLGAHVGESLMCPYIEWQPRCHKTDIIWAPVLKPDVKGLHPFASPGPDAVFGTYLVMSECCKKRDKIKTYNKEISYELQAPEKNDKTV